MKHDQIDEKLSPIASFCRGVLVGVLGLQALQLLTPDLLMVHDWPIWLRAVVGVVVLLGAVNYLMAQRGFMLMRRMARD